MLTCRNTCGSQNPVPRDRGRHRAACCDSAAGLSRAGRAWGWEVVQGCRKRGRGRVGTDCWWAWVSVWGGENILEQGRGGGCTKCH